MAVPTKLIQIEAVSQPSTASKLPVLRDGDGISDASGSTGSFSAGGPVLQGIVTTLARGLGDALPVASLVGGCIAFEDSGAAATWILPTVSSILAYLQKQSSGIRVLALLNNANFDEIELAPVFDCTFQVGVGSNVTLRTNTGIAWYPNGVASASIVAPTNIVLPPATSTTFRFFAGAANTLRMVIWCSTSSAAPSVGTVTSVGLTAPVEFISGPVVTGAGNLTLTKATQAAGEVWVGPVAPPNAVPSFRRLQVSDLPFTLGEGIIAKATAPSVQAEGTTQNIATRGFSFPYDYVEGGGSWWNSGFQQIVLPRQGHVYHFTYRQTFVISQDALQNFPFYKINMWMERQGDVNRYFPAYHYIGRDLETRVFTLNASDHFYWDTGLGQFSLWCEVDGGGATFQVLDCQWTCFRVK